MAHRRSAGILTIRRRGWRAVACRVGAAVGTLALLLQVLAFTGLQPAKVASAAAFPFNEPGALCGMPDMAPSGGDDGQTPLRSGMVCPVCQTVQAVGSGLLPPSLVLVVPAAMPIAAPLAAEHTAPGSPDRTSASPRGPPILL